MNILIFGIVSIFQIHLYDHDDESYSLTSWAIHGANFVVKLPELFNPQQKESLVSWIGMVIP